jgi:choline dehydrogenase-like flavoprotein
MERSGFGRIAIRKELPPDPNACHHAGTTRMHADPRWGVTDPQGRVHGTDNLFVAGGSLFPTSGYANPTLTIVALALRLADHLAQGV